MGATTSLEAGTVRAKRLHCSLWAKPLRYSVTETRLAMDGFYNEGSVARLAPPYVPSKAQQTQAMASAGVSTRVRISSATRALTHRSGGRRVRVLVNYARRARSLGTASCSSPKKRTPTQCCTRRAVPGPHWRHSPLGPPRAPPSLGGPPLSRRRRLRAKKKAAVGL